MHAIDTNGVDPHIAQTLSQLSDLDQGTLLTAVVRKVGQQRGPRGRKVVYGDDEVAVVIWTGFSYKALIKRSQRILNHQIQQGGYIERLARATMEEHGGTTIADVCEAIQDTRSWFRLASSDGHAGPDKLREQDSNWEPLEVRGKKVRGARVYRGPAKPGDSRAPVPGTVYVTGVKLGEKVLTPAPNGPWRPDSKPRTIAKQILKEDLPVGLFCQYRLESEWLSSLSVGKEAAAEARRRGIYIDPDALRSLFKIA